MANTNVDLRNQGKVVQSVAAVDPSDVPRLDQVQSFDAATLAAANAYADGLVEGGGIGVFLELVGGTLTGALVIDPSGAGVIPFTVSANPSDNTNLTDWRNSSGSLVAFVSSAGAATFTQASATAAAPTLDAHLTRKDYVDGAFTAHLAAGDPHPGYLTSAEGNASYVNVTGDTMTGALTTITPTLDGHAANKFYVDGVMNTHEAEGDPHAQYLTQTEGDARYFQIGGGPVAGNLHLNTTDTYSNLADNSVPLILGTLAADNLVFDQDKIQARTNNLANDLILQPYGGKLIVSGSETNFDNVVTIDGAFYLQQDAVPVGNTLIDQVQFINDDVTRIFSIIPRPDSITDSGNQLTYDYALTKWVFAGTVQVPAPVNDDDVARKIDLDDLGALYLPLTGGTLTGHVLGITPTLDAHLTRKDYVDGVMTAHVSAIDPHPTYLTEAEADGLYVARTGDIVTGQYKITSDNAGFPALIIQGAASHSVAIQEWRSGLGTVLVSIDAAGTLDMGGARIESLADPGLDQDAATKKYVDDTSGAGIADHLLEADPHTQYLLVDGTRAMTGDLLMGGNDIQMSDGIIALRGLANNERLYVDTVASNQVVLRAQSTGELRTAFGGEVTRLTWDTSGVRVHHGLLVDGDLTVSGTTTTVNSESLLLEDPIIRLGGVAALTTNDGMDRGVEFRYYDGTSKLGFMGWDNGTGKFVLLTDTTNLSEVVTGTKAELDASVSFSNILDWAGTLDTRYVNVTGDTMTGHLITITPTLGGHAVNKTYADGLITAHLAAGDPHPQYLTSAEGDALFLTPAEGNAAYDAIGTAATLVAAHHDAASADHDDRYYTETESDDRFLNATGDTLTGTLVVQNGINVRFTDKTGIYPSATGGFEWDLNNDFAKIYAQQPSSDNIDFVFKLQDNALTTERFIFWVDDYQGAAFDRWPIIARGDGGVFFGLPNDGAGNPILNQASLEVAPPSGGTSYANKPITLRSPAEPTLAAHVAHKGYVDGVMTTHLAALDPHPQYLTPAEGDAAYVNIGGDTLTGRLILDGATGFRVGVTNKYEVYLGTDGPEIFNRAITSTNQMRTLWNTSATRWIFAPAPAGTPDYTKEFEYDFATSRWGFETPLKIGVGTATTDAVQKTYVDTAISGVTTTITDHISDSTDAHLASAIGFTPPGAPPLNLFLTGTNVQTAISQVAAEVDGRISAGDTDAIIDAINAWTGGDSTISNSNVFQAEVILTEALAAGAVVASKISAGVINASHIEANSFTGDEFNASSVIRVGPLGSRITIQGTALPATTSISVEGSDFGTGDGFYFDGSGRLSIGSSLVWDGLQNLTIGDGFRWNDETGTLRIGAAANASPLADFDAVWEARLGDATTIPNTGLVGTELDATNNGLIRVEGPAVWTPDVGTNAGLLLTSAAGDQYRLDRKIWFELDFTPFTTATGATHFGFAKAGSGSIGVGTGRSYDFYVGNGSFRYSPDGNAMPSISMFGSVTLTAGVRTQFRFWFDPTTGDWESFRDGVPVSSGSIGPVTVKDSNEPLSFFGRTQTFGQGAIWHGFRMWDDNGVIVQFDPENIVDPIGPVTLTTGQVASVLRHTSGPVTTIVPGGAVEYINPDTASLSTFIDAPDSDTTTVETGEDFVLVYAGRIRSAVGGNRFVSTKSSGSAGVWIQSNVGSTTGSFYDTATDSVNAAYADTYAPVVVVQVLDIGMGLQKVYVYDSTGLVGSGSSAAAGVTSINPGGEWRMGGYVGNGVAPDVTTFSATAWKKGVGVAPSDTEVAEIADYLLNQPYLSGDSLIESNNFYRAPSSYFSTMGSRISLSTGEIITPQLSVDSTTGAARFKGELIAPSGDIGGWTIAASTLTSGDMILDAADSKLTVGSAANKIILDATNDALTTYIGANATSFAQSGAGMYADASGRFSLGDQLTWNGTTLEITGSLTATTGAIGGWIIGATDIHSTGSQIILDSASNVITLDGGSSTGDIQIWSNASTSGIKSTGVTGHKSGSGFRLDSGGSLHLGSSAGEHIYYDATDGLVINTANFDITAAGDVTVSGTVNASGGTFSSTVTVGTAGANRIHIVGGASDATTYINSGTTTASTGTGFFIGADGKVNIGSKLIWDGVDLSITGGGTFTGVVSGGSIDIGGADGTSFHVDTTGQMWLGAASYALAPFRVSATGQLDIGGTDASSIHIAADGNMWAGAGTYATTNPLRILNTGAIHVGGNDATSWHVDATGNMWNGAGDGSLASAPFSVNNAGYLKAESGLIGGINLTATKLYVGAGAHGGATTQFYVDNTGKFSLKDQLVWDGNILTIDGDAVIDGDALVKGSVSASKIYIGGPGDSLIMNGDFLAPLDDAFHSTAGAIYSRTSTYAKFGNYSLQLQPSGSGLAYIGSRGYGGGAIAVSPGDKIVHTVWFKAPGATTGSAYLRSTQYLQNGTPSGYTDQAVTPMATIAAAGGDGWYEVSVPYTVPANIFFIQPMIYNLSGDVDLYVDGWKYQRQTSSVLIEDGAVTADKVATDALVSKTYTYTSGNFSDSGTYFNLATTGYIRSKNFAIDTSGNAFFKGDITGASGTFAGTITAEDGFIGGWTINPDNLAAANNDIILDPSGSITVGASYGKQITLDSATGTANATWDKLAAFDGLWLASEGDDAGIPNMGKAGAGLDVTNTGLVRVEGPAVWLPGASANSMSVPSFWGGTGVFPDDVEILLTEISMDWAGAIPGTHHFLAFGSTGPFRVTYFGETFYVSLATGGGAFSNTYTFSDAALEGAGMTDEFLDFRWRYTSSTGVVTMDWRQSGNADWISISPASANPRIGPLTSAGGTVSWYNTSFPSTWRGRVEHRNGFDGPAVFAVTPQDIANAAPNATSFTASTGQTVTVARGTSGPVTAIVPSGVQYINPNDGIVGNRLESATSTLLSGSVDEDYVIVWAGQLHANTLGFGTMMSTSNAAGDRLEMQRRNTGTDPAAAMKAILIEGASNIQTSVTMSPWVFEPVVYFATLDRATDQLHQWYYTESGGLVGPTTLAANVGAMDVSGATEFMRAVAGGFTAAMVGVGVGVAPSQAEMVEIADYLLSDPVVPPASQSASIRIGGTGEFNQRADTIYLGDNQFSLGKDQFRWDGTSLLIGDDFSYDSAANVMEIDGGTILADTIQIKSLGVSNRGANLIANASFDDADFAGTWRFVEGSVSTGVTVVDDAVGGAPGNYAMQITGSTTAFGSRAVPVVGGKKYRIAVWMRAPAGATGSAYVRAAWKDSQPPGGFVDHLLGVDERTGYTDITDVNGVTTPFNKSTIASDTAYTLKEFVWDAPSTARWMSLSFYNWAAGNLYIAQVDVVEQFSNASIQDGVITGAKLNATTSITVGTGTYKVKAIGGAGTATYLGITSVATPTYDDLNTPFYAGADQKVSISDKLTFDGANLYINGSGFFTGDITGASGTFSGAIAGGTIDIGGADATSFHVDATGQMWLGNALYASAPFKVSAAGAVAATSGTIGGWTLASTTITGTNLVLTNTGNLAAGTANTIVRISANDATYRLWVGHATAASAPFRVTSAGALTATSATITGTITSSAVTINGGTISSSTYSYTSGNYSTQGLQIGMGSEGYIRAKNFGIDGSGNAFFKGNGEFGGIVTASGGSIGLIDIGAVTGGQGTQGLFVGTGVWNNAATQFYIDDAGDFSLGNKLWFDASGPTLQINGDAIVNGTLSGSSIIAGTLSGDSIIADTKIKIGTGATYITLRGDSVESNTAITVANNEDYSFVLDATQYLQIAAIDTPTITGDVQILVHAALDEWNNADFQSMASSFDTATLGGYELGITDLGYLRFVTSTGAASATTTGTIDISTILTDRRAYWIRGDFDVSDGSGNRVARFYWAESQKDEPTTWSLIEEVVTAGSTGIGDPTGANGFRVGRRPNSNPRVAPGRYFRTIVRNGIYKGSLEYDNIVAGLDQYSSFPDAANLDITGNFAVRLKVAADWFSNTTTAHVAGKWTVTGNQATWRITREMLGSLHVLRFFISDDGTPAGAEYHGGVLLDPDLMPADGKIDVIFMYIEDLYWGAFPGSEVSMGNAYISYDDGATWKYGYASVPTSGVFVPYVSTSLVTLGDVVDDGAINGLGNLSGRVHEFEIYNDPFITPSSEGTHPTAWLGTATPVLSLLEADFPTSIVGSFVVNTGQTVTVSGTGSDVSSTLVPNQSTSIEIGNNDRPTTDTSTTFTATSGQTVSIVGSPEIFTGLFRSKTTPLYADGIGQFSVGDALWYDDAGGLDVRGDISATTLTLARPDGATSATVDYDHKIQPTFFEVDRLLFSPPDATISGGSLFWETSSSQNQARIGIAGGVSTVDPDADPPMIYVSPPGGTSSQGSVASEVYMDSGSSSVAGSGVASTLLRGLGGDSTFNPGEAYIKHEVLGYDLGAGLAKFATFFVRAGGDLGTPVVNVVADRHEWMHGAVMPMGAITAFAGTTIPNGWAVCEGQSLPTASYPMLFAVIGYTYGGSGGNFNLPNLNTRIIRHAQWGVNSPGSTGGTTSINNANHSHSVGTVSADHSHNANHGHDASGYNNGTGWPYRAPGGGIGWDIITGLPNVINWYSGAATAAAYNFNTGGISANHVHSVTNGQTGTQNNSPPYMNLYYIIRIDGTPDVSL